MMKSMGLKKRAWKTKSKQDVSLKTTNTIKIGACRDLWALFSINTQHLQKTATNWKLKLYFLFSRSIRWFFWSSLGVVVVCWDAYFIVFSRAFCFFIFSQEGQEKLWDNMHHFCFWGPGVFFYCFDSVFFWGGGVGRATSHHLTLFLFSFCLFLCVFCLFVVRRPRKAHFLWFYMVWVFLFSQNPSFFKCFLFLACSSSSSSSSSCSSFSSYFSSSFSYYYSSSSPLLFLFLPFLSISNFSIPLFLAFLFLAFKLLSFQIPSSNLSLFNSRSVFFHNPLFQKCRKSFFFFLPILLPFKRAGLKTQFLYSGLRETSNSKFWRPSKGPLLMIRFWPKLMVRFWPIFRSKKKGHLGPEPNDQFVNCFGSKTKTWYSCCLVWKQLQKLDWQEWGQNLTSQKQNKKKKKNIYIYI